VVPMRARTVPNQGVWLLNALLTAIVGAPSGANDVVLLASAV
jgi:hypothetical protein